MSDRFYVSLTATCDGGVLPEVLADMQDAMRDLARSSSALQGLSLSFSRDDDDEFSAETVALPPPAPPPAGPVTSTGPGTPPPDAVAAQQLPTPPTPTTTDGQPAAGQEPTA